MLHDAVLRMWSARLGIDVDGLDLRDRTPPELVTGGFLALFAFRNREGGSFLHEQSDADERRPDDCHEPEGDTHSMRQPKVAGQRFAAHVHVHG